MAKAGRNVRRVDDRCACVLLGCPSSLCAEVFSMRRSAIVLSLLMVCVPAVAQKQPVDYPLTVHVKSSNIDSGGSMIPLYLSVVIDGKTLELMDAAHGGNF